MPLNSKQGSSSQGRGRRIIFLGEKSRVHDPSNVKERIFSSHMSWKYSSLRVESIFQRLERGSANPVLLHGFQSSFARRPSHRYSRLDVNEFVFPPVKVVNGRFRLSRARTTKIRITVRAVLASSSSQNPVRCATNCLENGVE